MNDAGATPTYLAAEAVLEIDELTASLRDDVPSLLELVDLLRKPAPSPTFEGYESVSMLADVRSYSVLRNALGESRTRKIQSITEFQDLIDRYLEELVAGVNARSKIKLEEAKLFCQELGTQFMNRQLKEVYQHREQSDLRYISHDAVL